MFARGSFRRRFLVVAAGLGSVLLTAVFYSKLLLDRTGESGFTSIAHSRELQQANDRYVWELQKAEVLIYRSVIAAETVAESALKAQMVRLRQAADAIAALPHIAEQQATRAHGTALLALSEQLEAKVLRLIDLTRSVEARFPAMPVVLNEMFPTNQRFQQALQLALMEAEDESDRDVLTVLYELRHAWIQQIMQARLFIANRFGVYGAPQEAMARNLRDRDIYIGRITVLLARLEAFDAAGRLNFVQREALEELNTAFTGYEMSFARSATVYRSGEWRTDLPLIKREIEPVLRATWTVLRRFSETTASTLQQGIGTAMGTAERLGQALWLVGGAFFFLALVGYLAFERLIRGPLLRVAAALEAEGRGDPDVLLPPARAEETARLVRAFTAMRAQVRSRQSRLELILDNAHDGILTFGSDGAIETFNKAAEALFGYRVGDVLGRHVRELIPDLIDPGLVTAAPVSAAAPGDLDVLTEEPTLTAQRKDGSTFPMSVKVGTVELDGRRLYTALVADVSERRQLLLRLHSMATRDSLTGLFNRRCFQVELGRVLERASRGDQPCTLLYIDLDNFKYVNDTLGHQAGDRVLVEVAGLLRQRTRRGDLLARLGGDEFSVLLYECTAEQGLRVADAYRNILADYIFHHNGVAVDVGCSIGVAALGEDVEGPEQLLARADLACHLAKREGRNRCQLFRGEDRHEAETMSADMGWTRRIKEAIDHDQFQLVRQPIASAADGSHLASEVLLRLPDGEGGTMMPSAFLAAAERFGLAPAIDRWVVAQVVAIAAGEGSTHAYSVNLSARSLGDGRLCKFIARTIDGSGVNPRKLIFEISETAAITDFGAASNFLALLQALGCRTAVDDFGAGYSSFAYLRHLPFDYLKLDGSFSRQLHDPVQRTVLRAINDIAHALGKQTVAEHVETKAERALLIELGVDFLQGWEIGRPRPFESVRTSALMQA